MWKNTKYAFTLRYVQTNSFIVNFCDIFKYLLKLKISALHEQRHKHINHLNEKHRLTSTDNFHQWRRCITYGLRCFSYDCLVNLSACLRAEHDEEYGRPVSGTEGAVNSDRPCVLVCDPAQNKHIWLTDRAGKWTNQCSSSLGTHSSKPNPSTPPPIITEARKEPKPTAGEMTSEGHIKKNPSHVRSFSSGRL